MESAKLYISRCLQLARLGEYYVAPNPMVGAVLVHHTTNGDVILGEGWHMQYGAPHAEPNCIRNAEEAFIECATFGLQNAYCYLYSRLLHHSHATACHLRIGV